MTRVVTVRTPEQLWQRVALVGEHHRDLRAAFEGLARCPWLWPTRDPELALAMGAAEGDPLDPGEALLIAVERDDQPVLVRAIVGGSAGGWGSCGVGPTAAHAWSDARSAVAWATPFAIRALPKDLPKLEAIHPWRSVVDGSSFGLAFALMGISFVTSVPMPATVAALATVDSTGRTGPVAGLRAKMAGIVDIAFGIQTVIVHSSQVAEAQGHAGDTPLRVVGCDSLGHAVDVTWPTLAELVDGRCADPQTREEWTTSLYRNAFSPRKTFLRWQPIRDLALRLMGPEGATSDDRLALRARWVFGVAARHCGEEERVREMLPTAAQMLEHEPNPDRQRRIRANYIQFATDCGVPLETEVRAPLESLEAQLHVPHRGVPGGGRASLLDRHELRMLGAWARLHHACGEIERAQVLSLACVEEWLAYDDASSEATHPLAALLIALGVCPNEHRFARAAAARSAILEEEGPNAWVELAWARALLGAGRPEEALAHLSGLRAVVAAKADYLLYSHARWTARAARAAKRACGWCLDDIEGGDPKQRRLHHALHHLDEAVEADDAEARERAWGALMETNHRGLCMRMREHVPPWWVGCPEAWVASAFPY